MKTPLLTVTIEGPVGSGRTTLMEALIEFLKIRGIVVYESVEHEFKVESPSILEEFKK